MRKAIKCNGTLPKNNEMRKAIKCNGTLPKNNEMRKAIKGILPKI